MERDAAEISSTGWECKKKLLYPTKCFLLVVLTLSANRILSLD
jgi:hypothetical protein